MPKVLLTNTIVEPIAVVIESWNTFIARSTVLCSSAHIWLTDVAVELLFSLRLLRLQISTFFFMDTQNLKRTHWVLTVYFLAFVSLNCNLNTEADYRAKEAPIDFLIHQVAKHCQSYHIFSPHDYLFIAIWFLESISPNWLANNLNNFVFFLIFTIFTSCSFVLLLNLDCFNEFSAAPVVQNFILFEFTYSWAFNIH